MSAIDQEDVPTNLSPNLHFNDIVKAVRSRRDILKAGLALGAVGFLSPALVACSDNDGDDEGDNAPLLGFAAVAANTLDTVTVPAGYKSAVFCRWGDPLFADSPAWRGDATDTADAQARQFGDNHDGMHYFPLGDSSNSTEGLLVMNHEYINSEFFYTAAVQSGATPWSLEQVRKAQHAHGVSVAHIRLVNGSWQVVTDSSYNRRIHVNTPMLLTGPAAGHELLRTSADPTGTVSLGTVNNCGNGYTLWGTYLTCEENFNGYFGTTSGSDTRDASMRRYGLAGAVSGYRWEEHDDRFDYAKEPNESNRMGWIVEIDPFDPSSTPKKRTALGRIKHENAAQTLALDNRVVVYMGDDQANDYVYKFVSTGKYSPTTPDANRNLLETGTLYVAKFEAGATAGDMMGTGSWIALVPGTATTDGSTLGAKFGSLAGILVQTRLAGDAVGATKMDRPEWVNVHPSTGEVYLTLTNNSNRSTADEANPRTQNIYGQIVRWRETGGDAAAATPRRRPSNGICSCSRATRRIRASARSRCRPARPTSMPTTCSTAPTVSPSTPTAACGSRPTATSPTPATSRAWATTRCSWPTRRPRRFAASSSVRQAVKSPASPSRRTRSTCSSTCSIRASTAAVVRRIRALPASPIRRPIHWPFRSGPKPAAAVRARRRW